MIVPGGPWATPEEAQAAAEKYFEATLGECGGRVVWYSRLNLWYQSCL